MHCVDTSGVGWGGLITSMYACTSAQCYVDVTFLHACTSTQCYFDATSMHRGVATFGPPHTYIHTLHYIALHYITLHTYIYIENFIYLLLTFRFFLCNVFYWWSTCVVNGLGRCEWEEGRKFQEHNRLIVVGTASKIFAPVR